MDPTQLEEIRNLKHRYCHYLDAGDVERFPTLFTDDATLEVPNYGLSEGLDEIRDFIQWVSQQDLSLMAHMAANPLIEIDDTVATGRWYYTVILTSTDGSGEWGQGIWSDKYRLVDGEWRFESIVATRQFTNEFTS